jgi:hypothetical protein
MSAIVHYVCYSKVTKIDNRCFNLQIYPHIYWIRSNVVVYQFPSSHLGAHFLHSEQDPIRMDYHYEPPKNYVPYQVH